MASISQLVSEIAHSLQQPDSVPVRRGIALDIIHARNKLIRHSFEQHNLVDKVIQQRYYVTLINCPDGDLKGTGVGDDLGLGTIKRSKDRVPRPVRLTNGLPFLSVRTLGVKHPVEIAYVPEASSRFYNNLPGFCNKITYDYINQYLYVNIINSPELASLGKIAVESPFEVPFVLDDDHFDKEGKYTEDSEFIISEDMVLDIKKLVIESFNPNVVRETEEIPIPNLMK